MVCYTGGDNRSDSEEAEYAWLSMDSLKPFREGDSSAFEEDKHISDPTLKACIAAAERAVKTAADRAAAAAADAEQEGEDVNEDSQSDSDGGETQHRLAQHAADMLRQRLIVTLVAPILFLLMQEARQRTRVPPPSFLIVFISW